MCGMAAVSSKLMDAVLNGLLDARAFTDGGFKKIPKYMRRSGTKRVWENT